MPVAYVDASEFDGKVSPGSLVCRFWEHVLPWREGPALTWSTQPPFSAFPSSQDEGGR